jgi:hypothetical protein
LEKKKVVWQWYDSDIIYYFLKNGKLIMNKKKLIGLLMLCANINISFAQTVDLTSVDEFFKVTSTLKEGKEISLEQWKDFDSSSGYREFAERKVKTLINTIKSSINIVFGNGILNGFNKRILPLKVEQSQPASDQILLLIISPIVWT